jgi:hypothetical protein
MEKPTGLTGAAVAWAAAPAKGGAKGQQQAVVYQMPWPNPRPGVVIKSIDMRYNENEGSTWGTPALLGVTAARE